MVRPEKVDATKVDILVPCALGNVVTTANLDHLQCKVIAGGASNILPDIEMGSRLHERGIVYVPHIVIDSGELMQADFERLGRSKALLGAAIGEIYHRTLNLLETAREAKEAPVQTVLRLAQNRMERVSSIGRRRSI